MDSVVQNDQLIHQNRSYYGRNDPNEDREDPQGTDDGARGIRRFFKQFRNPSFEDLNCFINFPNRIYSTSSSNLLKISSYDSSGEIDALHMNSPKEWRVVTFSDVFEGLVLASNVFTQEGCKHWYDYLLHQLPSSHDLASVLKSNIELPVSEPIEESNLRWITFGCHHDWNTRVYSSLEPDQIPSPLVDLPTTIYNVLGYSNFKPEAGIINYYNIQSRLGPHQDNSEPNQEAPLMSISLGASALFLIGESYEESTNYLTLCLNDGDVLIMGGRTRLAYHAVPKILTREALTSGPNFPDITSPSTMKGNKIKAKGSSQLDKKSICRINLNIRQVNK